jgi:DnaJ-class molecular chaperone
MSEWIAFANCDACCGNGYIEIDAQETRILTTFKKEQCPVCDEWLQNACSACLGTGELSEEWCENCRGTGTQKEAI